MALTKQEKKKYVKDLCKVVQEKMLKNIDKLPEDWNGFELRQLMDDIIKQDINYVAMEKTRKKEYKNFVLVNNII